ncbi:MAG: hypothetical protein CVU78_07895 [Elusimicrobia bacterium HGW-Elusimicrobia-2]|nr:MAG: hypothetical protein CVU78_07895 [Elusimicrobia bacterium HGW-Elusimicrobia-2]
MAIDRALDSVLSTNSKISIVRLFVARRHDFIASGRGIARLTGITPPAAHTSLKALYNEDILKRDIVGKQHIYRLNTKSRVVKTILVPAFSNEQSVMKDIGAFIKKKLRDKKISADIVSVVLYGSAQTGRGIKKGDVGIAVIVKDAKRVKRIKSVFAEDIAEAFYEYFNAHLDVYLKTKKRFKEMVKNNAPPVSTLMKSYSVIYGKDPRDLER